MHTRSRIAFVLAQLSGGIGKMRVHLANELVQMGFGVDFLLAKRKSPFFPFLDSRVRIKNIPTSHAVFSLPAIIHYVTCNGPAVVITERFRVNKAVLRAKHLSRVKVPVYSSIHLPLSVKLHHTPPLRRKALLYALRRYYQHNDGLIAVSQGVAKEIMNLLHLDPAKVKIIYNPVVTPDISSLANQSTEHPWLQSKNDPVILAVGRLVPQKDFSTLLKAFAEIRKQRACKLIILGEGEERKNLEAQIEQLGLRDDVDLPGFVENPYAFMAQSNVFALSSAWEGFGNVLAEAIALGVPAVSTNCSYGPSEILQDGKFGPLVQVGDARSFAQAILSTMDNPLETKKLQSAAVPYTVRNCADNYLSLLGLRDDFG